MNMTRIGKRRHAALVSAAALALIVGARPVVLFEGRRAKCDRAECGLRQLRPSQLQASQLRARMMRAAQNAKALLKAMSDYLAAQKVISLSL